MTDPAAIVAARLAELWRKNHTIILERLAALRSAHDTLSANPQDSEARTAGREAAHKLSGVLGVFGLPQGSEIAATLDQLLKSEDPLTAEDLSFMNAQISELGAVIASKPAD